MKNRKSIINTNGLLNLISLLMILVGQKILLNEELNIIGIWMKRELLMQPTK